jgi:hypothetical protein
VPVLGVRSRITVADEVATPVVGEQIATVRTLDPFDRISLSTVARLILVIPVTAFQLGQNVFSERQVQQ